MGMKEALSVFDISGSGLAAQRLRMALTAQNIANANSVAGPGGQPYRKKQAVFAEILGGVTGPMNGPRGVAIGHGVKLDRVVTSPVAFKSVYNPGHAMADAKGYVRMPNVDTMVEMVEMTSASRSYEANLAAMKTFRQMVERTLSMLK